MLDCRYICNMHTCHCTLCIIDVQCIIKQVQCTLTRIYCTSAPPPKHRHPPNTTSPAPNLYNNPPTPPYSYPITYPILFSSQASYQHLSTSHKTPPNAPTKPHPYIPPPSVHRRGSNISLSIKLTSATSFDSHFKRSNCKSTLVHTRILLFLTPSSLTLS